MADIFPAPEKGAQSDMILEILKDLFDKDPNASFGSFVASNLKEIHEKSPEQCIYARAHIFKILHLAGILGLRDVEHPSPNETSI